MMDDRPLTEEERRILAELELDLLRGERALPGGRHQRSRRRRRLASIAAPWWGAVVVIGAVLVAAGLITGMVPLAGAGYVVVLVGVEMLARRPALGRAFRRVVDALGLRRDRGEREPDR